MSKETLVSVRNLKKYFPMPKKHLFSKTRPVLRANDGVSLDIRKGEVFGLVGESGSGKSTFGRTLLQLYEPTDGQVLYYGRSRNDFFPEYQKKEDLTEEGVDLTRLKNRELRLLRKDLQMIFQDPYSSLNPRMTVGQ